MSMPINISTVLEFSKYIKTTWMTNVRNHRLSNRTIVVNLGNEEAAIATPPPQKTIPPLMSTILKGVTFISADSLVLLEVLDPDKVHDVILEDGWIHLHKENPNFPEDVPLYKSRQFEVGTAKLDPFFVTGESDSEDKSRMRSYKVKVNLWYCPPGTDCQIHDRHTRPEMLEVHTQIHGIGHMQKFRKKDFNELYEDVFMPPGFTHSPFTGVNGKGTFYYGWHQYYSDTECIWMANEFHPM